MKQELLGTQAGGLAWADVDQDGDLDLVQCGKFGVAAGDSVLRVYRNDAGRFVVWQDLEPSGVRGELAWGDIDRDGDPDLVVNGDFPGLGRLLRVYRNDGGTLVLTQSTTGSDSASVALGDLDNDGDLDLVATVFDVQTNTNQTQLFLNQGGVFVASTVVTAGAGSVAWADVDQDGDLDLLWSGPLPDGSGSTRVYRNDGGTLVQVQTVGTGFAGHLAVMDWDLDGDLDLGMCGSSLFGTVNETKLFRNDSGTFVDVQTLPGGDGCAIAWADADNDGDPDLLVTGLQTPGGGGAAVAFARLYRNDAGTFVADQEILGLDRPTLVTADFDNDGDADFAISGRVDGGNATRIYVNAEADFGNTNNPPTAPGTLTSTFDPVTRRATFQWSHGTDSPFSNTAELYYTIRVGTAVAGDSVVSGVEATPLLGNYGRPRPVTGDPRLVIGPVPTDTTLRWSVRARDLGLRASAFSAEQTLATPVPPAAVTDLQAVPGAVDESVRLSWTAPGDDGQVGTATTYLIRVATLPISTEASFAAAASVSPVPPTPAVAGTIQSMTAQGLEGGVTFYFAMKAVDEGGNTSGLSNGTNTPAAALGSPIRINEVAPAQTAADGSDVVEFVVGRAGAYGGFKFYELANAAGSELVKTFPTTGIWSQTLAKGTLIVLHFNSPTSDETTLTNNVVNVFTTDTGLQATDNVLLLSDAAGLTLSGGQVTAGRIVDGLAYADQNTTELTAKFQAAADSAVSQSQWTRAGSVSKQFDGVTTRSMASGQTLARDEKATDLNQKADWSFRTTLSTGAVNGLSTTDAGDGTAVVASTSVLAGSTTTFFITFNDDPTHDGNIRHTVTIDIPLGWTVPQVTTPGGVGFTTTPAQFASGYALSVLTGISGIAGRIVVPSPLGGYSSTQSSITVQYSTATVQLTTATVTILVQSDDTGVNVGPLTAGSPVVAITGTGGSAAPRLARTGPGLGVPEELIQVGPNVVKGGAPASVWFYADWPTWKAKVCLYTAAGERICGESDGGGSALAIERGAGIRAPGLAHAAPAPAYVHRALWNGRDETGAPVASGVYFADVAIENPETGERTRVIRKFLVIR